MVKQSYDIYILKCYNHKTTQNKFCLGFVALQLDLN